MRKIVYLLIILLCPLLSYGQYSISGTIKDGNRAVAGATVYTPDNTATTTSDKHGKFTLESASDFDSVYISSLGFATQKIAVADKAQSLIINLQLSTELSPVEILGVKKAQSVNTLTEMELNRTSGLSLQDALNTIPGINMQSRTPWGGQHIIIRGYYPSADNGRSNGENFAGLGYQLYIDNIPVTDATGTTVMDDIDFSSLGKVEVIKGPSPLYGSYVAGAVNLYTPRPTPNQTSIQEEAIGGSYGLFRNNTTIQTSTGKSDIWINYGHQTYNGFRPNDASQKDYASFASDIRVSSKQTLSTYFSYNHSNEQLAGEIDSADLYARNAVSNPLYVGNNSHVAIESFRAGVTDKYVFNKHFGNQTTLFATGLSLDQAFAHGFNKNQNMNLGGRSTFGYDGKLGSVGISGLLGVSFQKSNQSLQGNFFPPFVAQPFTSASTPNSQTDSRNYAMNYNFFTQWTFNLPLQFALTVGGSMNYAEFGTQNLLANKVIFLNTPTFIKSFSPVFTPNASLIKVFNDNVSAYASFAMGYAPPALSQTFNSAGIMNTDLTPEKATQFEIGSKGSFVHNKLAYQVALFDMNITDRLVQETINSVSAYTNAGEQKNLGAEVYVSYDVLNNKNGFVTMFRPWVTYTYSHFTYGTFRNLGKNSAGADTILSDFSNNKVAAVSPNVLNAGIDLRTRPGFGLSVMYRYVDKAPVTFNNDTYVKAYSLLSARIDYRKQFGHVGLDVFVGGDNLLGSTYYSFIFVGQNIQELGQATDPYIKNGGGDGYILPAPYDPTFYGGVTVKYIF